MAQTFSSTSSPKALSEALQEAGLQKKGKEVKTGAEESKIEELSAEERKKIGLEMVELAATSTKKQLEEIKKKKEELELTGKSTKIDQVDISDVETTMEAKQGGLPDYLAALPADHVLRLLWEEGYRARPDGTLYKATELDDDQTARNKQGRAKNRVFFWSTVILLQIVLLFGFMWYNKRLVSVRKEIVNVVEKKGIPNDDPVITGTYKRMYHIKWLPELNDLLAAVKRMPMNFDRFPDNEEPGSYLEYIQRHDKLFDADEAMEWQARVMRKPHIQRNKQQNKQPSRHSMDEQVNAERTVVAHVVSPEPKVEVSPPSSKTLHLHGDLFHAALELDLDYKISMELSQKREQPARQ